MALLDTCVGEGKAGRGMPGMKSAGKNARPVRRGLSRAALHRSAKTREGPEYRH